VHRIPKSEFDHGGTRQLGVELLSECGLIVFLTQDVILAEPESISRLLSAFDDPNVGVAYGRQLPRKGAGAIESHARFFNYPQQSHTRNFESRKVFGFKSTFCSDAFGAYRREALESVGGFIVGTIFGEDLLTTAKLHLKGWSSAYVGDARVYHSHGYSFAQEFTRYFDIGVGHARESSMLSQWGSLGGEGLRFVRSETRYLMAHEPLSIPSAYLRTFLKYSAYHLGKKEKWLPVGLKRRMSMNRGFWK
jgi:rhamnosyltransferase